MKIGSPTSRAKANIKKGDKVLDIGSGHFPHPKADIIVDKFVDDNTHRSDNIHVLKHQKFIQADGENLPFEDNEFDYVVCTHVLEHVENPERFISEMCRVAKRGYLETPSLMGEHLIPKASHRWVLLDIDGTVVMYEKEKVGFNLSCDFGDIFLDYFPRQSIGWKIIQRTHSPIITMNYEWEDSVDLLVNPEDEELKQFFTKTWSLEMASRILPQRTMKQEAKEAYGAFKEIVRSIYKSKVLKKP